MFVKYSSHLALGHSLPFNSPKAVYIRQCRITRGLLLHLWCVTVARTTPDVSTAIIQAHGSLLVGSNSSGVQLDLLA